MSGAIAMGSNKVTGLLNGTAATDAAALGQIPNILTAKTHNYIAETCDVTASMTISGQKGVVYFNQFNLTSPATLTNISILFQAIGSGLSGVYMGVYTQAGALVATTADISSALTTIGMTTAAFTTPYSASAGIYYAAILIGNSTTTSPTFWYNNAQPTLVNAGGTVSANTFAGGTRCMQFGNTLTALPSLFSGTPVKSNTGPIYMAIS